jgi:cbb3-type cytochrome oxidase maturation protein
MYIILFLILISLVVALGFLLAFIWAVKSGQYDDDYTPSMRVLLDDEHTNQN